MEDRQRLGEVRQVRAAVDDQARKVRTTTARSSRSHGICRGVRRAPEALQLPGGWHQGAHGMEADNWDNHLALFDIGLAAEEERETKAVVTQ